jgi:hypothetical protein
MDRWARPMMWLSIARCRPWSRGLKPEPPPSNQCACVTQIGVPTRNLSYDASGNRAADPVWPTFLKAAMEGLDRVLQSGT